MMIGCCSVSFSTGSLVKKEDPGAFTIPFTIGLFHFKKAVCDLGSSINFMPLYIYKNIGFSDLRPTTMWILMAYQTLKRSIGVLHNVLKKVESFIFPVDFVILD